MKALNSEITNSLSTVERNRRERLIAEARLIVKGETMMLATNAHLEAVLSAHDELVATTAQQSPQPAQSSPAA